MEILLGLLRGLAELLHTCFSNYYLLARFFMLLKKIDYLYKFFTEPGKINHLSY